MTTKKGTTAIAGSPSDPRDYHVTIKGSTPIQFSRRHEIERMKDETHDQLEERTWRDKAHLVDNGRTGGRDVTVPPGALISMYISAAMGLMMKVPSKGAKKFTSVFKGGIIVRSPLVIGHEDDLKANSVLVSATGISGYASTSPGKQVRRIFPMLTDWGGTYRLTVVRPEIDEEVLKAHADFGHRYIGLGSFRAQNGRSFGIAEVVSVSIVRVVLASKAS